MNTLWLSLDSPSAQRCINELWDHGRLFNDHEIKRQFEQTWKLKLHMYPGMEYKRHAFKFETPADLTYFVLRWS